MVDVGNLLQVDGAGSNKSSRCAGSPSGCSLKVSQLMCEGGRCLMNKESSQCRRDGSNTDGGSQWREDVSE